MAKHKKTGGRGHRQYAAVPVRLSPEGRVQVLLLTSRSTRRWVIPKGWPIRKLSPAAVATREAFEEAGLEGAIVGDAPVGCYRYDKLLDSGRVTRVRVDVFLLRVELQRETWPERAERETLWCDPEAAAAMVAEPDLAVILRGMSALVL